MKGEAVRLEGTIGTGTFGDVRNEHLRATGNIAGPSRSAGRLALLPALFAAFAFLFFVLAGPAASQASATTNLTATVTVDNKVYNGSDTAAINGCQLNGIDPGSPQVFCDISSATATFAQANAGTWLVSVSGLGLSGSDAGLYTLNPTTATATAQITPKSATAVVTAENKTYDANTDASATCSVAADVISGDTVDCNIGSATFDNKNVGTGKTVTATGINLTGAQSGNYALTSTTETATADITAKEISATVSASSKTYDGSDTASATCSPTGVESGDTVTCAVGSATFDDKNVGTNKTVTVSGMTLGGADAGNYSLSSTSDTTTADITAKTISATVSATARAYDGTDTASATCSPNGVESGDTVTCAVGSATFAGINVGTYTVTATGMTISGADAENYVLSPTTGTDTAAITARPLTANVTAANKVYDGNDTAALTGCTLGNVVNGEDVTCSTAGSTATFASENVANGVAVNVTGLTLGGTATLSNYSFAGTAATTANITAKSLTVSTTADNKVYDGTTAATLSACSITAGTVGSDDVNCNAAAATAAFANANVGNGKAVNVTSLPLTGTAAGNYTVNLASAATTADITQASLTATIQAANKVYDGNADATLTSCQLVGVIAPDAVTCVTSGATTTFDNKDVGTGKTVTATGLTLGGAQAGNYSFAGTATTTADITAKTLTATVAVANKVYDTNTTGTITSCTLAGVVSGEDVTCDTTNATATFNNKNVGTGKAVNIAGLEQAGTDSGTNYSLSATTTSTANITAAPISATVSASNKAYDGNTTASATCSVTPLGSDALGCAVGAANFVNASVGNNKTVNITGMTLTDTDAGNYDLSPTSDTTTADITAKALTAEITVQTKTYNGSAAATITACQLDGLASGEEVTCNFAAATATFADANAQVGKATSATGLTLSGPDAGNYTFTGTGTGTGTITPKSVTASITASNKVYDQTTAATLTGCTLSGVVDGEVVTCDTTGATTNFNNKNAGTGKTVTANGLTLVATAPALTGNYSFSGSATGTADITPLPTTANLSATNKVYDGNDTASATCSPAALIIGDVVVCQVGSATFDTASADTGKTVTVSGMTLSGTDAGNYDLNPTTGTTTADITKRPLTATVTAGNKVYDQTAAANLTSCTLNNVVSGDGVGCEVAPGGTPAVATFVTPNVGTGVVFNVTGLGLAGGAVADNYSFDGTASGEADITPKILTAVTTAANKVYDASTTATLTGCTLTGVLNPDVVNCDFAAATASFANANVGTNKTVTVSNLPLTGTDSGNYAFGPATITAVGDITVKSATPTLIAENKAYDGNATATATCTSADFVPGDTVGCSVGAASFDNKNIGNGKPVNATGLALTGASAANYSLTATTAATTADITPKVLIATITVANKVYDGNTSATITSCTPDGVVSPDVVSCVTTGATATFSSKNAGTGKSVSATGLTLSGADAGNYFFVGTGFGTAAITPKVVTPAITANNKVYDGIVTTTATCSVAADVVSGDTVDCTDVTAFFNNPSVGTNKTVNVAGIALGGADAGNYSLSSTSTTGTADITPKPVVPAVTASNKQYDGNADATITGCSLTGVLAGETATCNAASGSFANAAVGNAKTVTAAGVTLSGANAGNYALTTTSPATTANITQKQITATVEAANKQYNNSTTATITSCVLNNLVGSETVTCSAPTATFNNKNAGTDKPVTATGITLGGANAANYTLSPNTATTTANITQAPVTAVVADAQNKVYDGNTNATVNGCALLGLLGADVANCTVTTATFANKDVGAGKTVTATAFNLTGADGGNYSVSGPATTTANITAKSLTPSVTAQNKVYDGNTDATAACTVTGVVGDETVDCTVGAASFNNKNVGTAKPVSATGLGVTGADASNYSLPPTSSTTANISAKGLTAEITAANKPYDGNDEATITSCTLDGVVDGENVTCNTAGATATFDNRNPGNDKPVQATGLTLSGTDAGPNYLFNGNASTTADITAGTLTASVTVENKVYDGNATATVTGCSLTGVAPGDTVGCDTAAAQATFNNRNAGTGKAVSVTGLTLTGADKDEYQFNGSASGTADITQKAVTGATVVVDERPFNGDVNATIASCSVQGILSGDTVSCVFSGATATFANPGPGADIPVTATGLGLGGADAANYSFNGQGTGTGTITAAPRPAKLGKLTVKGPAKAKRGKAVTYRVTVPNTGGSAASGVRVSVAGKGVKASAKVGNIAAGASKTVKVKVTFKKAGKIKATFSATSGNAGSAPKVARNVRVSK